MQPLEIFYRGVQVGVIYLAELEAIDAKLDAETEAIKAVSAKSKYWSASQAAAAGIEAAEKVKAGETAKLLKTAGEVDAKYVPPPGSGWDEDPVEKIKQIAKGHPTILGQGPF